MNPRLLVALMLISILFGACSPATAVQATPDINAIKTSVARTVVAEITLTAGVVTATLPSPTATVTPEVTGTATALVLNATSIALGTPGVLCDSVTWNNATIDVNIPDDTQMTAGQEFVKTWKVRNDGSCAWGDGYGLIYAYGEKMSGAPQPLGTLVEPGQEIDISVNFKAPTKVGQYVSAWNMVNAQGIPFGKAIFVRIIVK